MRLIKTINGIPVYSDEGEWRKAMASRRRWRFLTRIIDKIMIKYYKLKRKWKNK